MLYLQVNEQKEHVSWIVGRKGAGGMNNFNYGSCHIVHYLRNVTQGTRPPIWQDQVCNQSEGALINFIQLLPLYMGIYFLLSLK